MLWLIRWILWFAVRVLLSLRYWVTLEGKSEVLRRPGPYLILPNHPAYMDPPNLLVRLWPTFRMRPMLLETNFQSPILAPFAFLLRAIKVPDTERASAEARNRAEAAVTAVIDTLKAGENAVLWPSGLLQRNGTERLGGARTVSEVLSAVPNVTVVLIRTRGLWGSMFSWAWAERPILGALLVKGIGLLLANLIVFAPRRRMTLTLAAFGPQDRPAPTRESINHWLEAWYNIEPTPEPPHFVPYHFLFGPRTAEFPAPVGAKEFDLSAIKPATKQAIAEILSEKLKRPLVPGEDKPEVALAGLGLDSLDGMEVTLQVEQRFGFTGDRTPTSIGELWALAEGLVEKAPPKPPPAGWLDSPGDREPLKIVGDTVPAAILHQAFRSSGGLIVADDLAGGVTYERLIVGAWALAGQFKEFEEPNIGLLLPASVACDTALLGLHLAGKLPVALNWTTGPANLAHAAKIMGLRQVITSKLFIDRTQVEVPGTQYVFLEDIRGRLGKLGLLRRLLAVRLVPMWTKRRLLAGLSTDPHSPAVVLFTSGSEKAPKAVPLTHSNILSDQRSALSVLTVTHDDSIMGFLPMFHSFGMTITGLLPLTTGVRVVHHPDPTDAGGIVRKIAAYKTTLIAGTPTFISYILDRAEVGELDSLRLIVLGAETSPESLFAKMRHKAPQARVVEGYGITECSPAVAITRPVTHKPRTIGPPLPGVEVCVTNLETGEVLPREQMGMLNVTGPIVFPGYIGYDGPSPFREIDGKRWYVTGDLGELDPNGEVVFHGRLKRFLKAGGEMISLPALEEPFAHLFPPTDQGPRVAVEGVDDENGRKIVLFTTEPIALRDANAILQKEGFRGVLRLDDVKQLDKLPILGTGKTDYKVLRAMISLS